MPQPVDFISVDVSFISLTLVLPVAHRLLKDGAQMVCLVKPQFEAGKDKVGKKGVVRDPQIHREVIRKVIDCAAELGSGCGVWFSPIKGPEGNIEYLLFLQKPQQEAAAAGGNGCRRADCRCGGQCPPEFIGRRDFIDGYSADPQFEQKERVRVYLRGHPRMTGYGCSCWMMEESMHEFAGQPVKSFPPQGQKIDMIFSIGGDGTLIHSARHAVEMDCPVLGINAGRLGFLTGDRIQRLGPSGADCAGQLFDSAAHDAARQRHQAKRQTGVFRSQRRGLTKGGLWQDGGSSMWR